VKDHTAVDMRHRLAWNAAVTFLLSPAPARTETEFDSSLLPAYSPSCATAMAKLHQDGTTPAGIRIDCHQSKPRRLCTLTLAAKLPAVSGAE